MPDPELTIALVDAEREFSGGEEQVFLLMEGLQRRGHRPILFCQPGSACEEAARARQIETRCVTMRNDFDLAAILRLRRFLAESAVDLVHLNGGRGTWLAGIASYLNGQPALTTRRQDRAVKRNWKNRLIYRRFVEKAVAISPPVADELAKGGVAPEKIVTIPSSVDPARLQCPQSRDTVRAGLDLDLDAGDFVILTMAKLVHRKGLDVLLDALARLGPGGPRVVALIAGDGPEEPALARQAGQHGLGNTVRFLGWRGDKAGLFAASDVFVLPSRREGLGVAALEAMAAGRPVIASRVGGLGEAVQDEKSGLLVPPEDPAALAAAIERTRAGPALCRQLGEGAIRRIEERHLAEDMVSAYERLYREILERSERP